MRPKQCLVALCIAVAVFMPPIALAQDSRTIRHAWAPSATVDTPFSWTLLWKGMDPSGQATVQSPLPPGITFDASTNLFQGTYTGAAPSTHETNLTFSSLYFGSGLTLQVHFTFFPSGGYQFRTASNVESYTSPGPYTPRVISEELRLNPALTNQYIPVVIQNNPYTRNESVEFYQTTVSSTNVVISFPNYLPVGHRAPILLWMHGNSYYGEYYIKTMEIAASHGIAMVAPNYLAWSVGTGLVQQRVQLLKQALDLAYSLNQNASSPLFNKLDVTSGYVIGGHSWGGATASLYSLTNRQGVRGSFIMDEIAMVSNPDFYPRVDGLQGTLPFWYSDPTGTPFGEIPMIYLKAPRSAFEPGIAEGASAYTSAPFATIVSIQEAFHESLLDAYPAAIVDTQVSNSTRQTAAHFIVAFMKRVVKNDLSMTDLLLGPYAAVAASRTAPFASRGVAVTTTDKSTQLIIEDFSRLSTNNLGNPTTRVACFNETLPGTWTAPYTNNRTREVSLLPSWQWILMNTSKNGVPSRWETVIGTLPTYSEYSRICVDLLLDSPPAYGTYLRFPQDVSLTLRFNLSSGSSVSLVAGQDFVIPDLQIATLTSLCLPLSTFATPILSVSAEVTVPAAARNDSTNLFIDRLRLERMSFVQEPPSSSASAPTASAPSVSQQPQSVASPVQLQPKAAQQPQQGAVPSSSPSRTTPSQTNLATNNTVASIWLSCLLMLVALVMH